MKSHYEVLGIENTASPQEIKNAYRNKALKYHPDKTKNRDEGRFIAIQAAYEVLSDANKKQQYDANLKAETTGKKRTDALLYLFFMQPLNVNVQALEDIVIPEYERLLNDDADLFVFLNRSSFINIIGQHIFNQMIIDITSNLNESNADKSISCKKKLGALIDKYNEKTALLVRADMLALQDYVQTIIQQAPEYNQHKGNLSISHFSAAWPLEIHVGLHYFDSDQAEERLKIKEGKKFIESTLRASPISQYISKGENHAFGFAEDDISSVSIAVSPTYFSNLNSTPTITSSSSEQVSSNSNNINSQTNDVERLKNKLSNYIRNRSKLDKYTGTMFGYPITIKVEAAQLLIDILAGRESFDMLIHPYYKKHYKALKEGDLGNIAKESLAFASQHASLTNTF